MIDIRVGAVPPFRLIIQVPHLNSAIVGGSVLVEHCRHPLSAERGRDRLVNIVRIVHDLVAARQNDAIAALRAPRFSLLLLPVLGDRVTATVLIVRRQRTIRRQFRSPVQQREGTQADRAGFEVSLMEQIEAVMHAVADQIRGEIQVYVEVLQVELPVIAGGAIAAPAAHADVHDAGYPAVGPLVEGRTADPISRKFVNSVDERADRVS